MDTLVSLGSTTACAYSVWALLSGSGGHLFFMEAAAIITLISVGHWLESRVAARASSALNKLLTLAPSLARKLAADGREMEAPATDLETGDRVVLRPGDRVPVDGVVEEGASAVDESMLTGESIPVDKAGRSELYAGTVNLNGRLVMRVTATGEETALANIIAAVQRAQTSRANIQRLGDRVSNVFVPAIVLVAIAAGLFWALAPAAAAQAQSTLAGFLWQPHMHAAGPLATGLIIAAAVLIVACPCAMGLATPAAIMAGSNAAAERGILIRDGVALEKAGQITAVMLDKTGTLTLGRPTVAKVREIRPGAAKLAASLARGSAHPLSQAIASGVALETDVFTEWEEVRGSGVQARLKSPETGLDGLLRLGSVRWLQEQGVDLTVGKAFEEEWSAQGASLVGLAHARALLGLFAIKDALKSGASDVIGQLEREGLKTYLVTGDNKLTALNIAKQIGIPSDRVFAEVRPEQKAVLVKQLQEKGERVAFVGDGINDAPALEQADLGIAVSKASDIAREAADIILLKSEIEAIPESLGLARATLRTIKQNLFWAFFYNLCSVPLAALGFMSPVLCAAAMGLSDLVVIGNALRLRSWRKR
jgi:Cu+-exporting ATPase